MKIRILLGIIILQHLFLFGNGTAQISSRQIESANHLNTINSKNKSQHTDNLFLETIVWEQEYGPFSEGTNEVDVEVDKAGNIYVVGNDNNDILLMKINTIGEMQWIKYYNGIGDSTDKAIGLSIDENDFIYVAGYSIGVNSDFDYIIIKYDSTQVHHTYLEKTEEAPKNDANFNILS